MVFLGTFYHALDAKNRLTIPVRLREGLGTGLILTRGFDACLMLYPQDVWEEQARRLSEIPTTSHDKRVFTRWVYGGAAEVALDKLGRILIPEHLCAFAELKDQAVIVGTLQAIEIWSAERHATNFSDDEQRLPASLDRMSERGV